MIIRDPRRSIKCVSKTTDSEGDRSSEVIVDGAAEERDRGERRVERDTGIILCGRINLPSTPEAIQRIVLEVELARIATLWVMYHARTQEANKADEDDLSQGGSPYGELDGSKFISSTTNSIDRQSRSCIVSTSHHDRAGTSGTVPVCRRRIYFLTRVVGH